MKEEKEENNVEREGEKCQGEGWGGDKKDLKEEEEQEEKEDDYRMEA